MGLTEAIPLWDSVTQPIANALEFAFGCRHHTLSRVFTIDGRSYKVCCDCGARFRYSLETMSIVTHHKRFPSLRRLQARQRRKSFLQRHRAG
jgi:hypothetical protein